MTNRLIPSPGGKPLLVYTYDGADWRPLLIDTAGRLQIDVAQWETPLLKVEDSAQEQIAVFGVTTIGQQHQLRTDTSGHLQIDVLASALPSGAATQATLANLLAKFQDQALSQAGVLANTVTAALSGANGYISSGAVGSGDYWKVTAISCRDRTTAPTAVRLMLYHDGTAYPFGGETAALAISEYWYWGGEVWLDASDTIRVYFVGGAEDDNCDLTLVGHKMTVE